MTEQEAIRCLEEQINIQPCGNVALAFELAIKALEKQIAKKPVGSYKNICPSCFGIVIRGLEFFCPKCGQNIDEV